MPGVRVPSPTSSASHRIFRNHPHLASIRWVFSNNSGGGQVGSTQIFAFFATPVLQFPALWNKGLQDRCLMKCPFCHEGDFAVIDSRQKDGDFPIRRRRACVHCKRRVWTIERIEEVPLKVVKKSDERRESYDAAKF